MQIVTIFFALSLILQPNSPGRRIINLSRLKFSYEVPDSILRLVHFRNLTQIDSGWEQVDKNILPWHKVQYLAGWQKKKNGVISGIFIGLQAPVHKLRDKEYVTNWIFSLHEYGIEDASLTNDYKLLSNLDWEIYEITSSTGNGLFLGNGDTPTAIFLGITQLAEDKPSHVFPLILVYGATELSYREEFLKTYRKFLTTISIKEESTLKEKRPKNQQAEIVEKPINHPNDVRVSFISVEKKSHAGIGYTRYVNGLNGLTLKLLLNPGMAVTFGGFAEFKDTSSYDYHIDGVLTLFEVKIKGPLSIYLSGGGRYYRDRHTVYRVEFPFKFQLTHKNWKPAYLMFGLWYSYDKLSNMKNSIGLGWGIQVLPFVF